MKYTGKLVEIMSMSECPNQCLHCFINYKGHIDFDQLESMLKDYSSNYDKIILNGTELLMDKRYIEMCSIINQDFIYTNGRLLTSENRKILKANGINRVSISLHYGIQEKISKSTLQEISKIIKETVEDGFYVRILCTISKDNYKLLPEITEYVYSLGAKSIKFINMIKEGKAEDIGEVFLTQEEIYEFFEILQEVRKKYDKNEFYVTRNGFFGPDNYRKNNFKCIAGEDSIIITPDHKVYPCNGLLYDEYVIGHWDETGIYIDKILEHESNECLALARQLNK